LQEVKRFEVQAAELGELLGQVSGFALSLVIFPEITELPIKHEEQLAGSGVTQMHVSV